MSEIDNLLDEIEDTYKTDKARAELAALRARVSELELFAQSIAVRTTCECGCGCACTGAMRAGGEVLCDYCDEVRAVYDSVTPE